MTAVRLFVTSTTLLFLPLLVSAQDRSERPPLITDRPDFTESGISVPRGSVQIEGGLTWERFKGELDTVSGPETLVRYGIGERLELRVGLPNLIANGDASGAGDSSLGAKLEFGSRDDAWDLAGILTVSIPTGDKAYSSDGIDPSMIIAAGIDLSESWSFGTQISAGYPSERDQRAFEWGGTLVLGRSLTDRSGAFFEIAAVVPETGTAAISFHTGFVVLLSTDVQFDVHGGTGLSDTAPDVFIGAGLAARF